MRAQEVIDYCRILAGDPHGDVHTDEKMLLHLNTVCRDISVNSRSVTDALYLPAVSGQARYGLPEGFLRLEIAGWQTDRGRYRPLSPITMELASWMAHSENSGRPRHFDVFGRAAVERVVSRVVSSSVVSTAVARVAREEGGSGENRHSPLTSVSVRRAQQVFSRYRELLKRADMLKAFPPILLALKSPEFEDFGTELPLTLAVPLLLAKVSGRIDADSVFINLLQTDADVRAMIGDPQVQQVLRDPAAIDELLGAIGYAQLSAKVYYVHASDEPPLDEERHVKIDALMKQARHFFSTEMESNGYGAQTFDLQEDEHGVVEVTEVPLPNAASTYVTQGTNRQQYWDLIDTLGDIDRERENRGLPEFSVFFINVGGEEDYRCGWEISWNTRRGNEGEPNVPHLNFCAIYWDCNFWQIVAHEIGHIVGLQHPSGTPVPRNKYIMSYGYEDPSFLLPANAKIINDTQAFGTLLPSDEPIPGDVIAPVQGAATSPVVEPPPAVAPPPLDVDEQWVRLDSGIIEGIKRGDRIVNVSDGSATGRVIEARNVLNARTNEVEQIILYSDIEDGTRTFLQAGDVVRVLSPGAPRHSLIITPVPTEVGDIGDEALFLFIARTHRKITARDVLEENDDIELDAELEPALREYILYYMQRDEKGAEHDDVDRQLVRANTLYQEALPNILRRIRAWKVMWHRRQGVEYKPTSFDREPVAQFPIGSAYPSQ